MTQANRLELAGEARAHVARVIALLEQPTAAALDDSAAELRAAIARMEKLQSDFKGRQIACPTRSEISALRTDLRRAGLLLRNAWELRNGRVFQFGYTRKGELVRRPASASRWALEA